MNLDANACGVIATVIPVYFLVLVVGEQRLIRGRTASKAGRNLDRVAKGLVVALTLGEATALIGMVTNGFLATGLQAIPWGLIVLALGYSVSVTAFAAWTAIDDARWELERRARS